MELIKCAFVVGTVLLFDDMFQEKAPWYVSYFLPTWVWLLPGERAEPRVPFVRKDPPSLFE